MNYLKTYLFQFIIIFACAQSVVSQTKLISYNVKNDYQKEGENNWASRKDKMKQLLHFYEPAFIGVQEALLNQVKYLDSCLTTFDYIGVGRDDGKTKGEYCAIFFDTTLFTVSQNSTFWLSDTPDKISVGWDAALERICTYGLFENKKTQKRIWILNTHFDHLGKIAREKSAELILKRIRQLNQDNLPVVLMGDLNVIPKDKPIQLIKTGLTDAMEISVKPFYGPIGTFNGFKEVVMDRRIDYFFTHKLKVLYYVHIDDKMDNNNFVSDHLPVLISIRDDKIK